MLPPYQSLLFCCRDDQEENSIILGASGSSIFSFSSLDGSFLSEWSSATPKESAVVSNAEAPVKETEEVLNVDHIRKRRKLSTPADGSSSESPEIVVDNGKQRPSQVSSGNDTAPIVLKIISTSNGEHVIAITGEDKCVRVLKVQAKGRLETLSERYKQSYLSLRLSSVLMCTQAHAQKTMRNDLDLGRVYYPLCRQVW